MIVGTCSADIEVVKFHLVGIGHKEMETSKN